MNLNRVFLGEVVLGEDFHIDWFDDSVEGYGIKCDESCDADCCRSYRVRLTDEDVETFHDRELSMYSPVPGYGLLYVPRFAGRCIYLNNENKCGVYEYRPSLCRVFPFGVKQGVDAEGNKRYGVFLNDFKCGVELMPEASEGLEGVVSSREVNEELIKLTRFLTRGY